MTKEIGIILMELAKTLEEGYTVKLDPKEFTYGVIKRKDQEDYQARAVLQHKKTKRIYILPDTIFITTTRPENIRENFKNYREDEEPEIEILEGDLIAKELIKDDKTSEED